MPNPDRPPIDVTLKFKINYNWGLLRHIQNSIATLLHVSGVSVWEWEIKNG